MENYPCYIHLLFGSLGSVSVLNFMSVFVNVFQGHGFRQFDGL